MKLKEKDKFQLYYNFNFQKEKLSSIKLKKEIDKNESRKI